MAMAVHRLPMQNQKGCSFYQLLGTGRNGTFDLNPDWQQWGLLAVWDNEAAFEKFKQHSFPTKWWNTLGSEQWTIILEPIASHGKWDNKEPFGKPVTQAFDG